MKGRYMEKLVGKYCKIVMKEPGEQRASVITGTLEDVDYTDGFILIDSSQGLGCIRIDTVIAIKPGNLRKRPLEKIKEDENGMIGIGALIVFIAMVLVAAVAASVIIQTSESLQQRAYAVGKQTTRSVSSGMEIVDLTGYTDVGKTSIEYLAISIKPRAGSFDIDLNETLLYIEYDNLTVLSLGWEQGELISGSVSASGVFHTLNHSLLNSTNFGMIAIRDSDGSVTASYGMSSSDMVMVIVNLSAAFEDTQGLPAGKDFMGRIVPETGSAGIFLVSAPSAFEHRIVEL